MNRIIIATSILVTAALSTPAAAADKSSGRQAQEAGMRQVPSCTRKLGTIAIVEPETQWWTQVGLGSPEAMLKVMIAKSGCFGIVDRGRGLAGRAAERGLADAGELQAGSNIGGGQVKAADYMLVPDLVTGNNNSGGGGIGAALGGLARSMGGWMSVAGGINMKKKEANVTLALVNARTTEQERLTEGYARKKDVSFSGGMSGWSGGTWGGADAGGYTNTELGQVVVLAYLDAYTQLVQQLGGLPANASAAAPQATAASAAN